MPWWAIPLLTVGVFVGAAVGLFLGWCVTRLFGWD